MTYLHRVTFLAIVMLALPGAGVAQWATQSGGAVTYTGGNVGIGTTSPGSLLQVGGSSAVATASPTAIQMDNSFFNSVGASAALKIYLYRGGGQTYGFGLNTVAGVEYHAGVLGGGSAYHAFYTDTTEKVRITNAGYVGIGTTMPNYPLSVNGVIQAKEIIVNTGWSDYVFDASYRLAPLTEVAAYVDANHHLPGIPSSSEVAEKGIGVGEIESKLLAKIEELTLHMIEADRENRALRERVQKLESGRQK